MTPYPRVSVVCLSYNRPQMLREALTSIRAQTLPADEVLVIDNRSERSGEVACVAADFPEVRLIASESNLGFTGGMNLGITRAEGEWVMLTEDDMILQPDCLLAFLLECEKTPAGLYTGVIIREGSDVICYAGGEIELSRVFRLKMLHEGEHLSGQLKVRRVGYVTGAMIFARRDFLRDLGGFRPEYFMYFEDVELSLRVRTLGHDLVVVPAAVAGHFHPSPGVISPLIEFHKTKNLVSVYALHSNPICWPEFVLRYGFFQLLRKIYFRQPVESFLLGWYSAIRSLPGLLQERRNQPGRHRRNASPVALPPTTVPTDSSDQIFR